MIQAKVCQFRTQVCLTLKGGAGMNYVMGTSRAENIVRYVDHTDPNNNQKGKARPTTCHEVPDGEKRYSSTPSLTSALDGGGWSTPRPDRFTLQKENCSPLYRRLCGPQGRAGRVRKISPQPLFDPRTVQPVASRYTDWAIPAHI